MNFSKKLLAAASITAAASLALAGCAESAPEGPEEVKVGIIYSESGALSIYGAAYKAGFEAGLDYVTDGTGEINGTKISVVYRDDAGNPETALNHAKTLIGEGYNIIGGSASSGVAVQLAALAEVEQVLFVSGPAATDALTGINKYTFRSGRQSLQDLATAGGFLDSLQGAKVVVFAQDTEFGKGNVAAAEAVLGSKGATIIPILVPEDATEFTPFAVQIKDANPDLVFPAWAGATSGAMWQALFQQRVFDVAPLSTGLGDTTTYQAFGDFSDKVSFLNHYFEGATTNDANKYMIDHLEKRGLKADLFSPDGFNAAIMIAEAIKHAGTDPATQVDNYIAALEGFSFEGPKGTNTVRAGDHALLQPMFQVKLENVNGTWTPVLVSTSSPEDVAPPAK